MSGLNLNNLATYLPQDRRRALATGRTLPDRAHGSVLFADISGFTPLTEQLHHALGSRRGAEELTLILNRVYTGLTTAVESHHGSVINFSGDAITCWFDQQDGPAPARALACAQQLQATMRDLQANHPLPTGDRLPLGLKVAVATGPVRRFVVGHPDYYWRDVLAGETVNRTAVGEHLATAGETLLDEATALALGDALTIASWRTDPGTPARFAVVGAFTASTPPQPPAPLPELDDTMLTQWLDPALYQREQAGHALLLTEFRPGVALFVRFGGIDYDSDTAERELSQFVHQLIEITARYEGTVIDLTFGDKGSYTYLNFGALNTHEDDARRAAKTALELRAVAERLDFLEPLQMGLTYGVMRTGAYGGATRRHYGALGDEVNLAARLMSTAVGGEILVSGRIYKQLSHNFTFGSEQRLTLKGKQDEITVFPLRGEQTRRSLPLTEPSYHLPLVGRQAELALITEKLALAAQGQSQIIALEGEAGVGKSRLLAEVVQIAQGQGFTAYGGMCQSDGLDTPYLVWKPIWSDFFHAPEASSTDIEAQISQYALERVQALPLLHILLGREMPPNAFTQNLEPQQRQGALHALLEACLQGAATQAGPLLLVLEDLHWLDALSHTLLEQLARATAVYPICFLLAHRPPRLARLAELRLEALPHYHKIELGELAEAEVGQIIEGKLRQLYPLGDAGRDTAVPPLLVEKLMARAQGNPFYLEELLNYLHDRQLDPWDTAVLAQLELPDTLYTLILSRIDQLRESEKVTLRVASIVGRLFYVRWLIGYYPALGELEQVQADLTRLAAADLTPLDTPEPELSYLFKHIITHEVTYESLPFATRARLHEELARYLEEINAPLDSIAHHYGQSENRAKKIEYFRRAGEAAQAAFANEAALDYFAQLIPLLADDPATQMALQLERGEIFSLTGAYDQAEEAYMAVLALATAQGDVLARAQGHYHLGLVKSKRGDFTEALLCYSQAEELFTAVDDPIWLARCYEQRGNVATRQGHYDEAETLLQQALTIINQLGDMRLKANVLSSYGTLLFFQGAYEKALVHETEALTLVEQLDDKPLLTNILSNIGITYSITGRPAEARHFYEQGLALAQAIGDKLRMVNGLSNLGLLAHEDGEWAEARALYEQSLALVRQTGNKYGECLFLINLGNLAIDQRDVSAARAAYVVSIRLSQEMNDPNNLFFTLSGLGATAVLEQNLPRAARLAAAAETLRQSVGTPWDSIEGRIYEETITAVQAGLSAAEFEALWAEGAEMDVDTAVDYALQET